MAGWHGKGQRDEFGVPGDRVMQGTEDNVGQCADIVKVMLVQY